MQGSPSYFLQADYPLSCLITEKKKNSNSKRASPQSQFTDQETETEKIVCS